MKAWEDMVVKKRLLLLLNPCAGQKKANALLPEIIRLYNDRDYECVTYVTAANGDATLHLAQHAKEYDHIVCIGGDGTLNETIAGMIRAGANCPVGYIPAGTTNDYASSLGLSTDILKAAADAVDGVPCSFDIGSFNGRYFIYTASCGAFARTSYTTSQFAKNLLGHTAYVLEGIRDLPNIKPISMHVEAGERLMEGEFIFCAVTNSLSVGGLLKLDPNDVRLNDGVFEVLLVRYPAVVELPKIITALRSGDLSNNTNEMVEFFKADKLKFTVENELEWTLDGERGEKGMEFELINHYKMIQLVIPEKAAQTLPVVSETVPAVMDMGPLVIANDEAEDQL